jgi:hypothetical protein
MQNSIRAKTLGERRWADRLALFDSGYVKTHKARRSFYTVLQKLSSRAAVRKIRYEKFVRDQARLRDRPRY